jgi:hypothetical protein
MFGPMARSISAEMAGGSPGTGGAEGPGHGDVAEARSPDEPSSAPAPAEAQSGRSRGRSVPPVIFIDGVHRSGTTVLAAAVTEAVGGVTTTVGVLARHIPALLALLEHGEEFDRGLDALAVTPETVEEYGFLISQRTTNSMVYGSKEGVGILREHIAELQAEEPGAPVILKNPHDVGWEGRLLTDFPQAGMIIMRRGIADIQASVLRSTQRLLENTAYARALTGGTDSDEEFFKRFLQADWLQSPIRVMTLAYLAFQGLRLAQTADRLPLHRVAFLTYEELRANPREAARWAAHLIDPDELAGAFEAEVFPDDKKPAPRPALARLVDRKWAEAWDRGREAQRRAGIIPWAGPS